MRKLGSFVFRTLRSLFLLRGINDTQCGFKTCRREAALDVFPKLQFFKQESRPTGWKVSAYDVELLHLFEKAGYTIKEVEVVWLNRDVSDTKSQQSDLARYLHESMDMAREVYRVKRNETPRGMYEVVDPFTEFNSHQANTPELARPRSTRRWPRKVALLVLWRNSRMAANAPGVPPNAPSRCSTTSGTRGPPPCACALS